MRDVMLCADEELSPLPLRVSEAIAGLSNGGGGILTVGSFLVALNIDGFPDSSDAGLNNSSTTELA